MNAYVINATHDPAFKSWVASANGHQDFPIQNLPLGIFRRRGTQETYRGGVAIGDQILDLAAVHAAGVLSGSAATTVAACMVPTLNQFMSLGRQAWSELRSTVSELLRVGSPHATALHSALVPQADAEYALPAHIGGYTDFYASIHHATTVGRLFRPDNPLLPNYKWVPIAYHGRTSTIRTSGQEFRRPSGQLPTSGGGTPKFGPSQRLDYELEVGAFVGPGNALGQAISIEQAEDHVFGLCLLNDWSARDIQSWEYQPLGPFLAKNFATTISPWIVSVEALAPFRCAWTRAAADPQPLSYLDCEQLRSSGGVDLELEAYIETPRMREMGLSPQRLSRSNFRHSYWSVSQMIAHHTSNGCSLESGDLLGSGTQSGPESEEAGSLLELTQGGKQPLALVSGEARTFIEDGDRVFFKGFCERAGYVRIGFGEVSGTVVAAHGH